MFPTCTALETQDGLHLQSLTTMARSGRPLTVGSQNAPPGAGEKCAVETDHRSKFPSPRPVRCSSPLCLLRGIFAPFRCLVRGHRGQEASAPRPKHVHLQAVATVPLLGPCVWVSQGRTRASQGACPRAVARTMSGKPSNYKREREVEIWRK